MSCVTEVLVRFHLTTLCYWACACCDGCCEVLCVVFAGRRSPRGPSPSSPHTDTDPEGMWTIYTHVRFCQMHHELLHNHLETWLVVETRKIEFSNITLHPFSLKSYTLWWNCYPPLTSGIRKWCFNIRDIGDFHEPEKFYSSLEWRNMVQLTEHNVSIFLLIFCNKGVCY